MKKGYTPDSLRFALINQGYLRIEIENCLEQAQKEMAESAPVLKDKPQIVHHIVDEDDNAFRIEKKESLLKRWFGL